MSDRTPYPEPLGSAGPPRNGTSNGLYYPAKADVEEDEVSLHEVLEVLFKNKWLILACFLATLLLAAVYTMRMDPEYEAASTVYVNFQDNNMELGDLLGLQETANRNIANEIEIIKSRRIATRVAEMLEDYRYVPGTDQVLTVLASAPVREERHKVAERLQGRVTVQPKTRGVDIIEIRATSTIPEEAALISTLYAEQYEAYNTELSKSRVVKTREFLDQMTDQYRQELSLVTDSLVDFVESERVFAPDEEASQLLSQVAELQALQSQARLELGEAQVQLRMLNEELDEIRPGLSDQLASIDDQYIKIIGEEIAKLEVEIEKRYARNPELRQNPSLDPSGRLEQDLRELQTLKEKLRQRSSDAAAGSEWGATGQDMRGAIGRLREQIVTKRMEVAALQARYELLAGEMGRARGNLNDMPRKEYILRGLQRARTNTEELYNKLLESRQEAAIAEQSQLGYVDIVDKAIVPETPVRPQVHLNLLLGAVFGLLLGIGLAFGRNALDNKVRKPEDLRKMGLSVVGIVPDMASTIKKDFKGQEHVTVEGHRYSTRLAALLNPLSPVAEGYRRVRTNLQFSRPDDEARTLIVTSPGPSEGKTVSAMNLAVTMAQAGRRVLYIDADLRRPQGHHMMGLDREPGLTDLLFEAIPDSLERFASDLDSYLYVVPAGREVPNPAEVLGSRKMMALLERWRKEFDIVVFDTPPTLIVADALVLAPEVDAVLVVCSAGETNRQAVERCVEALEGVGADVVGVLLNRFDVKQAYGGYKYGYSYGYEYGYGYGGYYYGSQPAPKGRAGFARRS
ncbi:MAG: polysaccharide biosynthesis tyrosine autokinase [Rhodothermales bacterium]|nr:polysaccharide biosynthesis tyrosine autokinase [Rhodothermales bacterium]